MPPPRRDRYGFPILKQGCRCTPASRAAWTVTQRKCNHSAFNGYRRTPSDYSDVHCAACGAFWRTRAAYVDALPDFTERNQP